jgi:hypothetical protein
MIPQPETRFMLSNEIQVREFYSGDSPLHTLVGTDGCIVLMPFTIYDSRPAYIVDPEGNQQTHFILKTDRVYVIPGKCSIFLLTRTKAACAVLGIWRESI